MRKYGPSWATSDQHELGAQCAINLAPNTLRVHLVMKDPVNKKSAHLL